MNNKNEKSKLNVLPSVERYEDLPTGVSIGDFTFIESLDLGVVYTSEGWVKF